MIFDTNVVSEPLQARPNSQVMRWLNSQDISSCYITTITAAELLAGVERLPIGKKREQLQTNVDHILYDWFANRILSFDFVAAQQFAVAIEKLRKRGLNGMQVDVMIAAIALTQNMSVATRDDRPYEAAGVHVINPWADE